MYGGCVEQFVLERGGGGMLRCLVKTQVVIILASGTTTVRGEKPVMIMLSSAQTEK